MKVGREQTVDGANPHPSEREPHPPFSWSQRRNESSPAVSWPSVIGDRRVLGLIR
jgi:hypothetical protein